MPNYLDAAFEVLRRENRPMHYVEIVKKAVELGILIENKFINFPYQMDCHIRNDINKKGTLSRFIKLRPQTFGLMDWAERYSIDVTKITPKGREKIRVRRSASGFTEIQDHKVLKIFHDELRDIRRFLKGTGGQYPSNEKLCFWVWFCYHFEFYSEAALIFRRIEQNEDKKDLYDTVRKIGLACESRVI